LIDGDHQIEIQADEWLGVGVDALPADYAVFDSVIGEQSGQAL